MCDGEIDFSRTSVLFALIATIEEVTFQKRLKSEKMMSGNQKEMKKNRSVLTVNEKKREL